MFEKASRMKLRFNCKGLCSVEDLWDLPLRALDAIFKDLNSHKKAQSEESLLDIKTQADEFLDLQIGIVKHIVNVRLQEQKSNEDAAAKAARKQKLLGILADKEDEALKNMSEEEIKKVLSEM